MSAERYTAVFSKARAPNPCLFNASRVGMMIFVVFSCSTAMYHVDAELVDFLRSISRACIERIPALLMTVRSSLRETRLTT